MEGKIYNFLWVMNTINLLSPYKANTQVYISKLMISIPCSSVYILRYNLHMENKPWNNNISGTQSRESVPETRKQDSSLRAVVFIQPPPSTTPAESLSHDHPEGQVCSCYCVGMWVFFWKCEFLLLILSNSPLSLIITAFIILKWIKP